MIKTKRWCDPVERDDGFRVLVCRYRPRALRKEDETWDAWMKDLGPSVDLHAAVWGKHGAPIAWSKFTERYLREMREQEPRIEELAARVRAGENVTLLCSSACTAPEHCHRSLLADLVAKAARGSTARKTASRSKAANRSKAAAPR